MGWTMVVRIGINGFGRIGRNVLRAIAESGRQDVQVVAINDLAPAATNAHLLRYDSVHGKFPGKVTLDDNQLDIGTGKIRVTAERDMAKLAWDAAGADVVMECTGIFTSKDKASGHLSAGAKRVIISAPGDGADLTVVYGVNHSKLKPEMTVISNASCTTNCLVPVAKVLNDAVGIVRGHMTTIHSFTNDQSLLDVYHKDLYRARAVCESMIPTSTGAAKSVGLVLPELKGKLDGVSIRVPTKNVSLVDLTFVPGKDTDAEEINNALTAAATSGPLKGILAVIEEPLVSIDFNHDAHSASVDLKATKVLEGKMVRVAAWYDNEWGFSNRMGDTAAVFGRL